MSQHSLELSKCGLGSYGVVWRYGDTEVERSYGVTELGGGRSGGSNGTELQRKG